MLRTADHQRQLHGQLAGIAAHAIATFAAVSVSSQPAAQWPERPVRLLVPLGAGGAADMLSRDLTTAFAQFANRQVLIVENRTDAGGTIAAAAVARQKPDGYLTSNRRSTAEITFENPGDLSNGRLRTHLGIHPIGQLLADEQLLHSGHSITFDVG